MTSTLLTAMLLPAALIQAPDPHVPQGVEYRIEARLDEETDILRARGELRYTNNAQVALDTLWFHQHLNAFRPESEWARRELEFGNRRFQDLGPEDHAFDRLLDVTVNGASITPVYPLSPDSTVAGFPLPQALGTGETLVVRMDWEARLATLPRRQGRSGRHFDFAQWYPRIAAYDRKGWQVQPLMPQGEFYGEFGRYDVVIELPEDQVIAAVGVPVEGDPGWSARAAAGFDEGAMNRDFYEASPAPALGLLAGQPSAGNKRVRWVAEDVHHFAWSANPEFVYEGGSVARTGPAGGEIAVHVLYWPSDIMWANGVALDRTTRALEWLQDLFGPYPWPQLTNLHRIESGGTEFPMMMMNGSPSEGLIVHEGTHQYLHGILANNEFAEGWLDEGFTSFITNWFHEDTGATDVWTSTLRGIQGFEAAGRSQPISLAGAEFRDPTTYSAMSYDKAALVLRMLRWMIGDDTMRQALRTLYERHALSHFDEEDLRRAVSDAAGENLAWFFDQWIHTTDRLDYAIVSATTSRSGDGWVTRVEVTRSGDAWMPVTLRVADVDQRLETRDRSQVVEVRTSARPESVVLDPDQILLDVNPANNTALVIDR
jgi:hypothetical protein